MSALGECKREHVYCIVQTASEMIDRGFTCYLEHEIPLDDRPRGKRAVVDILALKKGQEVLIEVGSLSPAHGNRLELLKKVRPSAKVIHITQWKNWLTTFAWSKQNDPLLLSSKRKDLEEINRKMGESLATPTAMQP
jgi:hypothetical protein